MRCYRGSVERYRQVNLTVASIVLIMACNQTAWGLISGGTGNEPINDPGWPKGAAAVFNTQSRVAWWEGPPFGGGQWHAECKGNATDLNLVLLDFSKMDVPKKRIVLHDGFGNSFWLNPNRDKDKKAEALIDWTFMVWQPKSLNRQRRLPVGIRPVGKQEEQLLAQLDVYTGGFVRWVDVIVPEGIEIVDRRLESHGFQEADGTVLEGKLTDVESKQPLAGKMVLERIEPQQKGGYNYTKLAELLTDANGHWVLKNTPEGWCRIVLVAEGYVSRVIGYDRFEEEPQWLEHNGALAKSGAVTGHVVDDQGKPLADVDVRFDNLDAHQSGERYEVADEAKTTTDVDGRFHFDALPIGTASVWIHKPGYVRPGLGPKIDIPANDVKLEMKPAAKLQVRVDFSRTTRPAAYIVEITPEGGHKVGSWGGSGHIDAEGQITYDNVPPGRYFVSGAPNPSTSGQKTDPVAVDLKGGTTTEITIKAR